MTVPNVVCGFFSAEQVPDEPARLQLYPDDRIDSEEYDRYLKKLNDLGAAAWEAFKEYRATVKAALKV